MRTTVLIVILSLLLGQAACSRKRSPPEQAKAEESADGTIKTTEGTRTEARSYLEKGKEFYLRDEDRQAAEAFAEAIKLDPDLAEAHFRLGLTNDALGREKEAEEAYSKAVDSYKKYFAVDKNDKDAEAHYNDAEAHYNLGQTYAGLRLYTEAVKEYRHATRLEPDDAAIYYDLGRALMRLAQYDEAAEAFAKSLELDPENYRAEDELAEAREGVKRIKMGKKHQEELLKKKKDEAEEQEDETVPEKPVSRKPKRTEQHG